MSPPPPSTTQGVESMPSHSTPPVAFSYIRFSTAEQRQGNSLDRQSEAARAWCARNGVRLDQSTSFRDLGRSAFLGEHRKNPDRGALAAFLRLVEQGKVPRGSFLVVENLDRLTREHVRAAVALFLQILEQGVSIVTTTPERVFRHDSQDMTDVIIAVVELSRGHGESARKSDILGSAWADKRAQARARRPQPARRTDRVNGKPFLTHQLPAWIEEKEGQLALIEERATVVKRIFTLAAGGLGTPAIIRRLTEEGVPAFGDRVEYTDEDGNRRFRAVPGGRLGSGVWTKSYLNLLLRDRRVLGEYQACGKGRAPDGDPLPGYFPAVIDEEQFW